MIHLGFQKVRRILCLGAHADDIEIGCGGTILRLARDNPDIEIGWIVFSGEGARRDEALTSAKLFLTDVSSRAVDVRNFRDRFFPTQWAEIKNYLDQLKRQFHPDLIFTHRHDDAHQDHRVLAELTWNTFRNHWILEYEIPKYEGDLGQPNTFVSLSEELVRRKSDYLLKAFETQHDKPWFTSATFLGLARIRGIESSPMAGYAEGFYGRKTVI
jgi:LmbE family N-acetylglucosaminyl deacetylase